MSNLPAIMHAVFAQDGALVMREVPVPTLQKGEALIKVQAAGLNRADIMQRKGKYNPPEGTTPILGLEVAGEVVLVGEGATRWKKSDKICALLAGGGYAEYVAAPEGQCLPWPESFSAEEAACFPEATITVWKNIFELGALKAGETVLVHGGASGIGHMAIQMAKAYGATVIVTVGDDSKAEFCKKLGADHAINYRTQDFAFEVQSFTDKRGVDVVLDMVGGDYVARNLKCLARRGRHVGIATQQGAKGEVNFLDIIGKELVVTGSTLRVQPAAEKARLARAVEEKIWHLIKKNQLKPHVFSAFPFDKAMDAHILMESSQHLGKIALTVN